MEGIKDPAARAAIEEFCNQIVCEDAPLIEGTKPPEHLFWIYQTNAI